MSFRAIRIAAPTALAALALAAPAGADYLTGATMVVGPGGVVNLVAVANPMVPPAGNFNSGLNNTNTVTISKTFTAVNQPIDISFTVAVSNPAQTEYLFNETISNRSGTTWDDFHWQLGFGTGANFVLAPAPAPANGISFNRFGNLPMPGGSPLLLMPDTLFSARNFADNDFGAFQGTGPGVANNTSFLATFAIDIPTGLNKAQLTLREFASPEPSSLALMAAGAAATLLLRARRRDGRRDRARETITESGVSIEGED
jgi:hypothetical protein